MRFIKPGRQIDFLGKRKITTIFSVVLVLVSLVSLGVQGLNFGIEFTGGAMLKVQYAEAPVLDDVRQEIKALGVEDAIVRAQGDDRMIEVVVPASVANGLTAESPMFDKICPRGQEALGDLGNRQGAALIGVLMYQYLECQTSGLLNLGADSTESGYGDEQRELGVLALLMALIIVFIYVAFRFEWRFSVGSVAALFHDVVIVLGFFSITRFTVDMAVLAALLAVIGYSLNDTIVVYDRIRERFREARDGQTLDTMNRSINETLSRTVVTSLTTLLVLIALLVFGGSTLFGFAVALTVGVLVGTYSSVFVASTAALMLGVTKEALMPREDEEIVEEFSDLP